MLVSTLCLYRKGRSLSHASSHKKEHDVNHGKWIGVGRKLEKGEALRNVS